MDFYTARATLQAVHDMPTLKLSLVEANEDAAKKVQYDIVTEQLDNIIKLAVNKVPDDYSPTLADRKAVYDMLNRNITIAEAFDHGPAVEAAAFMRLALVEYLLPINGDRCRTWSEFVGKFRDLLISDGPPTSSDKQKETAS